MNALESSRVVTIVALLLVLDIVFPRGASAQWQPSGVSVSAVGMAPDGSGGAWTKTASTGSTVHILGSGVTASTSGVSAGLVFGPSGVVADGSGGVVYVGVLGGPIIYDGVAASRKDAAGGNPWGGSAIVVCNTTGTQSYPSIAADGAGGFYVVWKDSRTSPNQLFAQKLNASGAPQWPANGVLVCSQSVGSTALGIIADGSGGAIICWEDIRLGERDVFAQRITAAGTAAWVADGVTVCGAAGIQDGSVLISDGAGGAIVLWQDFRAGFGDVYAQRIDASGTALWAANGVGISTASGEQRGPKLASDGAGGAFMVWEDQRSGSDIYGQHVDASGVPSWTADGLPICTAPGSQTAPQLASDEQGGMVVAWGDSRFGSALGFVQRVNAAGAAQWLADGIQVGTGEPLLVVADGSGGLLVCWGGSSVMRVLANGEPAWVPNYRPVVSVADERADQGGYVQVRFPKPVADGGSLTPATSGYYVWRRVSGTSSSARLTDGLRTFEAAAVASITPWLDFPAGTWVATSYFAAIQSANYSFLVPTHNDSTSAGPADDDFVVTAYSSPTVNVASAPVSGHSVDNLAPGPPQGLAGGKIGDTSVRLTWAPSEAGDLWHYSVHRGSSPSFVPSPANQVGQPTDPTWDDDEFQPGVSHYKVSAVDRHENASDFALLAPSEVTSVPPGQAPRISYLVRPAPNPFLESTVIEYALAAPGPVSLGVFDVGGRRVARLVEGEQTAGVRRARWSGRDDEGSELGPGLYVVRFVADGRSFAHKLIKVK